MKFFFGIFVLVGFFSCKTRDTFSSHNKTKPNIIYINVDDLGWTDNSIRGKDFYETPNLKKLAQEGMTFTRGYAGAANCAPSRACLLSGQNTPRHRVFTVGNSDRGNAKTRKIIPVPNNTVLADSVFTLAEMLKSAGYITGSFGKWHLGVDPRTQGFDVNVAGGKAGGPGRNGYFSPYNVPLPDGPRGENLTNRLTSEALSFIMKYKNSSKPFFVYLPYYAVHNPLATFDDLKEKYVEKPSTDLHNNAIYAGMIETVDQNLGRLLSFLKEQNLDKNTLIIFTSDNGGVRATSRQNPLRAGKGSYYEGGIRVPYVFKWFGHIKPGTNSNFPISDMDIYPTLMEITETRLPDKILDGESILPVLKGKKLPERTLFFHFPIYLQAYDERLDDGRDPLFRTRPGSVIIKGDWKLHFYYEDSVVELYNLKKDIGERHNMAQTESQIRNQLLKELNEWKKSVDAPTPTEKNPNYDKDFERRKLNEYTN